MPRHRRSLAAALLALATLSPARADARGGSDLAVTATAAVSGTVVSGTVAITNAGTKAIAVTSVAVSLEVKYASGTVPPPLPAGVTAEYHRIASVALPSPGSVPARASVTVPYAIDTCAANVARYGAAKDVRAVATTGVGTTLQARSDNTAAPSQALCPVCGNGRREGTEQCDGGWCCTTACRWATDGTSCTDANACTQVDRCQAGACVGGRLVVCTASDQCHVPGTCSPTTGLCSNPASPNGTPCSDGNACTMGDTCRSGTCAGSPVACNDANACTTDACAGGVCVFTPNANPCDDGDACTGGDVCAEGVCTSGLAVTCDDHKTCTDDTCDAASGCVHVPTVACEGCTAGECALCRADCDAANAACSEACWLGFWACLEGCTSTYCAPFCQVDLGACLGYCPAIPACYAACDAGNGCAAGCAQP